MNRIGESLLEKAVLDYLASLGWHVTSGPDIAPGEATADRDDYRQVLLARRLQAALPLLNPSLPPEALEDAYRKVANVPHLHPGLGAVNRSLHKMLTDGVDIEYRHPDGHTAGFHLCSQGQPFRSGRCGSHLRAQVAEGFLDLLDPFDVPGFAWTLRTGYSACSRRACASCSQNRPTCPRPAPAPLIRHS